MHDQQSRKRMRFVGLLVFWAALCPALSAQDRGLAEPLQVGLAEMNITPNVDDRPVWLAGFGQNRQATGVHDPIWARAVVLKHGDKKLALVSVDLVGLFHDVVLKVRSQLPGFTYVIVSSTHSHEGPDTLGIWGPRPFTSGIDPEYLQFVATQIVRAVVKADSAARPATARFGTASAPELLHDGREPYIKHDELAAILFSDPKTNKPVGILVQWNCHPETLGDKNTDVSSDYVGSTVNYLRRIYRCPVTYFTGTVGGLMTSLHVDVKNERGELLQDGTMEKTERYGYLLGKVAERALQGSRPVELRPLEARAKELFFPLDNKVYLLGRKLGVLKRPPFLWENDPYRARPAPENEDKRRISFKSEVGWLRLGEVEVALIPGEIYPELVLGKVQDPVDPASDFPSAPPEPSIYAQLKSRHRMIFGLANDEIGYIIPKRQWDEQKPFCYGRSKGQYGEVNSCGPETAPLVCGAFKDLLAERKGH